MYERPVEFLNGAARVRPRVGPLELTAGMYSGIRHTLLPVEQPKLEPRMTAVQAALSKRLPVRLCFFMAADLHPSMLAVARCAAVQIFECLAHHWRVFCCMP